MAGSCTVTANLQTIIGPALQGNAFVRFRLRNFSGFVPRVNGTAIVAESQWDVFPNSSGAISTTLWGNDVLNPDITYYTCEFWNAGRIVSSGNYLITGATFDLDSQDQLTPPPVNPAPFAIEVNGVMAQSQMLLNLINGTNVTIVDQGDGTVAISSTGGGIGPRPSHGRWAYTSFANASGDLGVYTAIAMNPTHYLDGGGSTAVLTNASATSGPTWTLTAPLIVEEYDQTLQVTPGVLVDYQVATSFYQSNVKQYLGLSDDGIINTGYAAVANMIAFRFDPVTAGDTHWMCQAQISNMAPTVVNTGVTPDATGALHIFEVQMVSGNAHYYIDGVAVGTIAAVHLPATTALLGLFTTADVAGGAGSQAKLSNSTWYWETSS